MNELLQRQSQLAELRSSCSNLESYEDVKDLALELGSSLILMDTEINSAKALTSDRLNVLQVQESEGRKKTHSRKYHLEVINSPSFIFHIFATFLLLTALAKLNNLWASSS